MSAPDRLHAVQAALTERGVRDVKFFLNFDRDTALSTLVDEVTEVLEAIQAGKTEEFNGLGDVVAAAA